MPTSITREYETSNQVFEEILSEQDAATITGVLIVQKESVVHLVETSMDTSTAFLRQIQSMEAELDPSARVMENVGCFLPLGARHIEGSRGANTLNTRRRALYANGAKI